MGLYKWLEKDKNGQKFCLLVFIGFIAFVLLMGNAAFGGDTLYNEIFQRNDVNGETLSVAINPLCEFFNDSISYVKIIICTTLTYGISIISGISIDKVVEDTIENDSWMGRRLW